MFSNTNRSIQNPLESLFCVSRTTFQQVVNDFFLDSQGKQFSIDSEQNLKPIIQYLKRYIFNTRLRSQPSQLFL